MRKRRGAWAAAVLIVALAGAIIFTVLLNRRDFTFIVDSIETEAGIYVVDDDNERVRIYLLDSRGYIHSEASIDKTTGEAVRIPDFLTWDAAQEKLYLYILERSLVSNDILSEGVYEVDFGRRSLQLQWELPTPNRVDQNNFAIQVRNGELIWVVAENNAVNERRQFVSRVHLYSMNAASEQTELAAVDYEAGVFFTDFFYSDTNQLVFTTPNRELYVADLNQPLTEAEAPAAQSRLSAQEQGESMGIVGSLPARDRGEQETEEPLLQSPPATVTAKNWAPVPERVKDLSVTHFATDGAHVLYITDENKGQVVAYDLSSGQRRDVLETAAWQAADTGYGYPDLKEIRFTPGGRFSAAAPSGGGKNILGVFSTEQSGQGSLYRTAHLRGAALFLRGLAAFLVLIGAFLVLWLLRRLFLWLSHDRVPIVTKMIAAFVPVIVVSIIGLGFAMNNMFSDVIISNQYQELYLVSHQQKEGITAGLLAQLEGDSSTGGGGDQIVGSLHYQDVRQLLEVLPESVKLHGADGEQDVYSFAYHWLYRVDTEGRLRSVLCDQFYVDIPLEYFYMPDVSELFYKAVRENRVVKSSFKDTGGEWITLIIPVEDDDGNIIAVMETGITREPLDYIVQRKTAQVNLINASILIILLLILSGIIAYSLRPLKKLRECVVDVTNGNLGVQAEVRGNDEVAEIAEVFNKMSTSVKISIDDLRVLNEGYYKFVPSKMFEVLNKTSVTDVRLGDQTSTQVTVMTVTAVDFEQIVSTLSVEDMFRLINNILSTIVPVILNNGGVIDKFTNGGCIAFFTSKTESALTSSVSVQQEIALANQNGVFGLERPLRMSSALSYGPVMIGIVGHEARLEATNISEHTNLVGYFQRIAPKYNARILTTLNTLQQIPGYETRYRYRFLGFLRVCSSGAVERLYDVFDGDPEETRLLKQQTKERFEAGVELFSQRRFYDARLVFIEVLKQFRQDAAAKEYLYLCDQYYQMADQSGIDTCIEEY